MVRIFIRNRCICPVLDGGEEGIWHEYKKVEGGNEYMLKVGTLCAAGESIN